MYVVLIVLAVAAAFAIGIVPVLCTIAATVAVSKLLKDVSPEDKVKYYGIPFGAAALLALLMLVFGARWYFITGAPAFVLFAGTDGAWRGKLRIVRKAMGVLFLAVIVAGVTLRALSGATLKKDARIGTIISEFKAGGGTETVGAYTYVKPSEAGDLAERFPEPYLFAWKNAATKKNAGNAQVGVSGWNLSANGYCLTEKAAADIHTVIIAVKNYTVAKPVVTNRSGGKSYGYYKGDTDYDLYFFDLDTKEYTVLECVKNGVSSKYRNVKCKKADAVSYVSGLYAK